MSRYARQEAVPEIGAGGQARLRASHVLVVGAGGLGVPVLQYLTGAGIGRITLVDGDRVEAGNLHRQPLYRMCDLEAPKVEAATRALSEINPEVALRPCHAWLTPQTAPDLVAQAHLVLDCADTFAASLTLSDCALAAGTPLVSASALGLRGYVGGFCGPAPSLRAVFPDLPTDAARCGEAGVMGPVVATIGALQAQMALAVLLRLTPSPLGQMMVLEAATWRMSGFRFDGAPEPDRPARFIAERALRDGDVIVDLRSEMAAPFRPDARHMPVEAVAAMSVPPGAARVVFACRTGLRAHRAGEVLRARWPGEIALLAIPDPIL